MNRTSVEQRFELLTKLGGNTDWNALSVEELQRGVLDAERAGAEFTRFVKNGFRLELVVRPGNWPVWRKLTIGGKSATELLHALVSAGCSVSDWAKNIMGKPAFTTLPSPQEIALVRLKVRDFGFTDPNHLPTTVELFARAKEFGLNLCPAESGPHLRLVLADQPIGDAFWVAMEPIVGSDRDPSVGYVGRGEGGRWLDASGTSPGSQWGLEDEIVFALGK